MTTTMTVRDVQHGLSDTLRRVERGAEVTITRHGKAVARLVPLESTGQPTEVAASLIWEDIEKRLRRFPGPAIKGTPVSDQIIADREDRV